ncbi:thioester-forming surface-anchored protein [Streptococcus dysgalactiae]|uniref:thioester-forming surface-anchored protein n=1 Tax=Streptococcus dysgalactiae TaxID=1334 RepID=UPI003D74CD78
MKNIVKKLLTTTAAVVVMSGSLGVGTLRVLAEQYYGYDSLENMGIPSFLYVTPKDNPKRDLTAKYIVYCFNRNKHYPDSWDSYMPADLPVYDRLTGTSELFKKNASKPREVLGIEESLVAVLSKGYPNSNLGLPDDSARKVTQLAIWYFSDNFKKEHFKETYDLSTEENQALQNLIKAGENPNLSETQKQQTLDLYIYNSGGTEYSGGYQNLLGSTLIPKTPEEPKVPNPKVPEVPKEPRQPEPKEPEDPKTPEEPKPDVPKEPEEPEQPEVPDIDVEITKPEIPTEPLVEPMLPLQPAIPITPKPEIPKEEDLGTVIGGGNVVEMTEDTATGSQGGAHNGVVSIQENKDPIVEETYDSPLPGQSGQSGSTTEVEDTKGSDVIVGGQGQIVETEESLSGEQGQSGSTTEVEDTKGPEVIIGGQGEVVDIEETLPTEHGQSGSTTEVEDTKGPGVIIGGQGEVVDIEESLPTEHGQSGSTTEVEDSKPKLSIHFDNEWPKEDKPQLPAVEKPKAKESLPAAGEAEHVLSTIVGAMILFLVSLWGLLKRKASKA